MPTISPVRTYGNPFESPGQTAPAMEPGRFPEGPRKPQPGHSWKNQFTGYEPSRESIVRDRHAFWKTGNERTGRATSNGGGGYGPDPLKDGRPQGSLALINRSFSHQIGNPLANQDDLSRQYQTVPTGQWAGTQDGSSSVIWGGTPGLWQPYGSYEGYGNTGVSGIQGPAIGDYHDGQQVIPNSPPHGLHSETMQNGWPILSRYNATPQQKPGRVDRPSNSPIAGQSFSQTVRFQGASAARTNFTPEGTRNWTPYLPGRNWRGN